METESALAALSALSQPSRLDTFKLLVKHEPTGLAAGEVARDLGIPVNTMSTHFAILQRAGLLSSERQSRSIIYRANLETLRDVVLFLLKDCCGATAELCAPLIAELTPCG